MSHSLPSSNSLTCVKYLSWSLIPEYYHSSTSTDFRHMACICKERWKNWYVKQSHLKGINDKKKLNEILTVAVIGIFILPALQSQISPKTNVMPWNVLLSNVKHLWHGFRLMWLPWKLRKNGTFATLIFKKPELLPSITTQTVQVIWSIY